MVQSAIAGQPVDPEVGELRLDRAEDGLYLSTTLQFVLPELAEDALYKGIPMFFVAEAQVLRDRWYWSDRQVAETTRYLRLSYQPLTRRWRLNISPVPFTNAMSLSQMPSIRSISGSGLICRSCLDPSRSVPWGAPAGISWYPAANA